MTKPHLTTNRDRLSARYKELHRRLRQELYKPEPEPDKASRKRAASAVWRQRAET